MAKIDVSPGGDRYLAWAKDKLAQLDRLRRDLGLPKMAKHFVPEAGALVRVVSSEWGDSIRIDGGFVLIGDDIFYPLWGIQSALMPGTRAGVLPELAWTPTVQHISGKFTAEDGSYVRRHWLVICRFAKRVAEYTWDEVALPAPVDTSSEPRTVQDGTIVVEGVTTIAVPSAPEAPNDGLSLDATLYVVWTGSEFAELTPEALSTLYGGATVTFVPGGNQYQIGGAPPQPGAITGEYVSHAADGTSVTLRDIDESGTPGAPYVVPISPSLVELSDENPWGWIDMGPSDLHPGLEPQPPSFRHEESVTFSDPGAAPGALTRTEVGFDYIDEKLDGVTTTSSLINASVFNQFINDPGVLPDFARWRGTNCALNGGLSISYYTGDFLNSNAVGYTYDHNRTASGPPALVNDPNGFDPDETYMRIAGGDILVHVNDADGRPWAFVGAEYSDGSGQLLPTGFKYATQRYDQAVAAYHERVAQCARNIIEMSSETLHEMRFGATRDASEVRPYEAVDHRHVLGARAYPVPATATYDYSYASFSGQFELTTSELPSLYPTTIYGATIQKAADAPPEVPWLLEGERGAGFGYSPAQKEFTAGGLAPAYSTVWLSRSTALPPVVGQSAMAQRKYASHYLVKASQAVTDLVDVMSAVDLDDLMKRLCVGEVTQEEMHSVVGQWVGGSLGREYREEEHEHVSGSFNFTQPAIVV